jgi:hypothetical protein
MVDEVSVKVLGDHRDPVECELLSDEPHGVDRGHAVPREPVVGGGLEQESVAVAAGKNVRLRAERRLRHMLGGR